MHLLYQNFLNKIMFTSKMLIFANMRHEIAHELNPISKLIRCHSTSNDQHFPCSDYFPLLPFLSSSGMESRFHLLFSNSIPIVCTFVHEKHQSHLYKTQSIKTSYQRSCQIPNKDFDVCIPLRISKTKLGEQGFRK